MDRYLSIWISFAIDCFGYSHEEAYEMFFDHKGDIRSFLDSDEIERMFEWSALPVPNSLAV